MKKILYFLSIASSVQADTTFFFNDTQDAIFEVVIAPDIDPAADLPSQVIQLVDAKFYGLPTVHILHEIAQYYAQKEKSDGKIRCTITLQMTKPNSGSLFMQPIASSEQITLTAQIPSNVDINKNYCIKLSKESGIYTLKVFKQDQLTLTAHTPPMSPPPPTTSPTERPSGKERAFSASATSPKS